MYALGSWEEEFDLDEGQQIVQSLVKKGTPYLSSGLRQSAEALQQVASSVDTVDARIQAADQAGLKAAVEAGLKDAAAQQTKQDLTSLLKLGIGLWILKKIVIG